MKTLKKYYAHFILLVVLLIAGIQTALTVHPAYQALSDDEKNKIEEPYEPTIEQDEKPQKPADLPRVI